MFDHTQDTKYKDFLTKTHLIHEVLTKFEHESSSKCICLNLSGYNFVVDTQKNCLSEKVLF